MAQAAPEAEFQFIAHLPEWVLDFPIADKTWGGTLPAIRPAPGNTVWGAVYDIDKADLAALDGVELEEQRSQQTVEAMDRTGKRHQVVVHLLDGPANTNGNGFKPSSEYLRLMVDGSRHWSLPIGWIAGLEEHLENGT
jgi:gamma-glutamylcyclotransferase